MKRMFLLLILVGCINFTYGQFSTPTINGVISATEYGDHTGGQNSQGNFYMTWDNDNLYIGIVNSNVYEGAVIYIDKNPIVPINGGGASDGTNVGFNYDGVSFAELQFRADLVAYAKNGYREYRTSNGSNGWSNSTSNFGSYSDNGTNIREFSIPWTSIGGRPSSFAWFGFVTYGNGNVYSQIPTENASGNIGASARYTRYYIINSTENNSSIKPFSRNSYVFNGISDITGFGAISVFDFTMNNSGRTITRAASGEWTVGGSFIINDGTVSFGSCAEKVNVGENVSIGVNGTLTLSSAVGGDLEVGGSWSNSGSFSCNDREVVFDGLTSQTISGATNFDYFRINNGNGVALNSSIVIDNRLKFDNGNIILGANDLTFNSSAIVDGTLDASRMLVCNGTGEIKKVFTGSGSFTFPVGETEGVAEYSPISINNLTATAYSSASVAVKVINQKHPNNSSTVDFINRYWRVTSSGITDPVYDVTLTYTDADINSGANESNIYCGKYNGSSWSLLNVTSTGTNTLSGTSVSSFSDFTGGEMSVLPVELISFGAKVSTGGVSLSWRTATEVNNYGFEVQRSGNRDQGSGKWEMIGFVNGNGNSNSEKSYTFTDRNIVSATKYIYRLKQVDNDGSLDYSKEIEVTTGVPDKYELTQNHPNPFNPATSISYSLPKESMVSLSVYSMSGEKIIELVNELQPAGSYSVPFDASQLASGTYLYRITANEFVQTRKMLLIK